MKVIWDKDTIKNIAKYISKDLKDQNLKKIRVFIPADLHRNTFDNLIAGKQGITFETVIKILLALEESLDALFLDLYPDRIIGLNNEAKKKRYIKSIINYNNKQSISKEEFFKLYSQYLDETIK